MFVDEVRIFVKAGDGGRGCISFRREKYVPRGGPDGGDGGQGGSVYFEGDSSLHTLYDFSFHQFNMAGRGVHGRGKKMHGRSGRDLVLKVPLGTVIRDADSGEELADMVTDGQRFSAAAGGRGGRGNARFATATDRAPRRAEPGAAGEERWLRLELKVLADVGIIGFPNAGKSTLLTGISEARPKTAPYPFTTLEPYLGAVKHDAYRRFIMADIPGLIEGAHRGQGLGVRFLKHVQRTKILLHLIDVSPETGRDPVEDWRVINRELGAFDPALAAKKQVVAANKIDCPGSAPRRQKVAALCRRRRLPFFGISALTGQGVPELMSGLAALIDDSTSGEKP